MKAKGRVIKGKREGTKIGFPTANVIIKKNVEPGIYAGYVTVPDSSRLESIFYVAEGKNVVECHILDFPKRDLYDADISVDLKHKLRDVQQFTDLEIAKKQITHDEKKAREWFRKRPD